MKRVLAILFSVVALGAQASCTFVIAFGTNAVTAQYQQPCMYGSAWGSCSSAAGNVTIDPNCCAYDTTQDIRVYPSSACTGPFWDAGALCNGGYCPGGTLECTNTGTNVCGGVPMTNTHNLYGISITLTNPAWVAQSANVITCWTNQSGAQQCTDYTSLIVDPRGTVNLTISNDFPFSYSTSWAMGPEGYGPVAGPSGSATTAVATGVAGSPGGNPVDTGNLGGDVGLTGATGEGGTPVIPTPTNTASSDTAAIIQMDIDVRNDFNQLNMNEDTRATALIADNNQNAQNIQTAVNAVGTAISGLTNLGSGSGNSNVSVGNWPTNYPDGQAIAQLGLIGASVALVNSNLTSLNGTSASISNNTAIGTITNAGVGATNSIFSSVGAAQINASNAVIGAVGTMGATMSNAFGAVGTNWFTDSSGGAEDITISLGNDASGSPIQLVIGLDQLPSGVLAEMAVCKKAVAFLVVIGLFFRCLARVRGCIEEVFAAPQLRGNQQMFFGFSGTVPTGIVYAAIIVASLAVLPTTLVASLGWFTAGMGGVDFTAVSSLTTLGPGSGMVWQLVTAMVPVATIVTGTLTWIIFELVSSTVIVSSVKGVKMTLLS